MGNSAGTIQQFIASPKGGGAQKGIGEKFAPDLQTGTGNFTVPIALPQGRNGFQPQLNLVYSTGNVPRTESGMSVRIANSRGIPGTLGCFARTVRQQRPVFLTSCHVLFAAGAARHDPVWSVHESAGRRNFLRLGSALRGKRGIVRYRGDDYFVDCAIGALDTPLEGESTTHALDSPTVPKRGDRVSKTGAATGTTTGIIVDSSYYASTDVGVSANSHEREPAPRQLLIRSTDPQRPFSEEGDSGALVFNKNHVAIGLLWGMTTTAESVACPIAPVRHALNI